MRRFEVANLAEFRRAASALAAAHVEPGGVTFDRAGLFPAEPLPEGGAKVRAPRAFVALAEAVAHHRSSGRWDALYRVLHRLTHGEPSLLQIATDKDVRRLRLMEKEVHHDVHHMHAFVRFRETPDGAFVAWHSPRNPVLRLAAPFFEKRFANLRWCIWTPDESVASGLVFGPGVPQSQAPGEDSFDELWRTYYAAIYNPARANPKVMLQHLPERFWDTLPEARAIPKLLAQSGERVATMRFVEQSESSALIPLRASLEELRVLSKSCEACELCGPATQTVFGEGALAKAMLIGEQPGDEEDKLGKPFVGPAGKVLDDALASAEWRREELYLTNAVKHFRYEPRGKQRIHQRPDARHVQACKGWLLAEIERVQPRAILCLGSTAAKSLLGPRFPVLRNLSRPQPSPHAPWVMATVHPAAILRGGGAPMFEQLVRDLRACKNAAG
jgi:probable DNA metabolism protein